MKHTKLQRMLSVMVATMVAFSMLLSSAIGVFAAGEKWVVGVGDNNKAYAGQYVSCWVYNEYAEDEDAEAVITGIKSSNTKVASVKRYNTEVSGQYFYQVKAKKKGTSNLTITYKKPDGTTASAVKTLKVKAYPNHIKSLRVNGKKVSLKGDKKYWYSVKNKKTSAKVNIKLKKGWKITNVHGWYGNAKEDAQIKNAKKLVKKGKKISFPKKWKYLYLGIEMKKGNNIIFYDINMYR